MRQSPHFSADAGGEGEGDEVILAYLGFFSAHHLDDRGKNAAELGRFGVDPESFVADDDDLFVAEAVAVAVLGEEVDDFANRLEGEPLPQALDGSNF